MQMRESDNERKPMPTDDDHLSPGHCPTPMKSTPTRWRRALHRAVSIALWIVASGVVLTLAIIVTPAGDWLGRALVRVDPLAKADYIVVLGGHRERAVAAAQLYRTAWAPKVIVSSTQHGAPALADLVHAYGVPRNRIILDSQTTRTATHPDTVAALPGVDRESHRFIIVTSQFHTGRARACFLRAGYRHICMQSPGWRPYGKYARPEESWTGRAGTCSEKVYEVISWAYYALRGWV